MAESRSRYFIRFNVADEFGVLGTLATELGRHEVSIQLVSQKEKRPDGVVPVVMLTAQADRQQLDEALHGVGAPGIARQDVEQFLLGAGFRIFGGNHGRQLPYVRWQKSQKAADLSEGVLFIRALIVDGARFPRMDLGAT